MADQATESTAEDFFVELERLLPVPPERVFDAFVRPEILTRWWGPEGFGIPDHDLDVAPNGKWRTVMRSDSGEQYIVGGRYRAIERPNRLVFTWAWENEDGSAGHESEVELQFRPAGSGTHLLLTHRRLESTESCDSHRRGWSSSLNDLERLFA